MIQLAKKGYHWVSLLYCLYDDNVDYIYLNKCLNNTKCCNIIHMKMNLEDLSIFYISTLGPSTMLSLGHQRSSTVQVIKLHINYQGYI